MGNVYIVRLKFSSPLHIGADIPAIGEETVQDIIHSDTIFSAIINNYAGISDKKENLKRLFEEFNTGKPLLNYHPVIYTVVQKVKVLAIIYLDL